VKQEEKLDKLKEILRSYKSVLIAFSGGVDSSFLVYLAKSVLHDSVLAVTATSSTYSQRELHEAIEFVRSIGVEHKIIRSEELEIPGFTDNPKNRCYYCKLELFGKLKKIADEKGCQVVCDAANYDDVNDYRPGMKATQELGVISPLLEAKLTKNEIRQLSKNFGLKTWNKPAKACLASRIPYGEKITQLKLDRISKAEDYLSDLGFGQVRVRYHGDLARIELESSEISKMLNKDIYKRVHDKLKDLGFTYVTLDLKGYRQGSLNEVLKIR
jgi:pyridinium-3,5-biscarboxylic acid mononucleotide sulfurtransferase